MVTIEINGKRIEADTMAKAHRLAKKEERKQAAEHKAQQTRDHLALESAYASLGKLAYRVENRPARLSLIPAHGCGGEDEHGKQSGPTMDKRHSLPCRQSFRLS